MQYSTHSFRHLRFVIGQNIHKARSGRKMTLEKLSRLSGVSGSLIDSYELGKYEISLNDLYRISCALEIDVTKLMVSMK